MRYYYNILTIVPSVSPLDTLATVSQDTLLNESTIESVPSSTSPPETSHSTSDSSPTPTTRSSRVRRLNPKYFGLTFVNNTTTKHLVSPSLEPTCVSQACINPLWRKAMSAKFDALMKNATWDLVPFTNHSLVGCKWVFRIKRHLDGTVAKYKARLVAKGFHQHPDIDDSATFSPVIKPTTIRLVLSIALCRNWSIRQLNVNNAFLHGTLHDEVYMSQPPGFRYLSLPNHVCRIHKAIYSLKQAPRAWYQELRNFLLSYGFTNSFADTSLFIYSHHSTLVYFIAYVDDIVLTGNNDDFIRSFVTNLDKKFSLKDLGPSIT